MKKKRKKPMRCPYCGAPVVYRSADGIYHENKAGTMLYVCSRYPECDAYVRAQPGTSLPLGTLANGSCGPCGDRPTGSSISSIKPGA